MNISIIGSGYVGLVTAVGFAAKRNHVYCYDKNSIIINKLKNNEPPFYEKGLGLLMKKVINDGKLIPTNDFANSIIESEITFIAVGTPDKNGNLDLSYIRNATKSLALVMNKKKNNHVIVVKSTVLPGTTENIVKKIVYKYFKNKNIKLGFAMNPEFLREGNALEDFLNPDRIVIGTSDPLAKEKLKKLYKTWNCDKIFVNTRTAEMIKYTNNIILATQISTVNELANLSSKIGGIDFLEVLHGVYTDKRWNPIIKNNKRINTPILQYLFPGPGYGGSCFPKDINAIISLSKKMNYYMPILSSVKYINIHQHKEILNIILKYYISIKEKTISILGLSFKPDTDDVRETPALKIIIELLNGGAYVRATDPLATQNFSKLINNKNLLLFKDWKSCVIKSDIIIVVTNWDEYAKITAKELYEKSKAKLLIDTRRIYNKNKFSKYFNYTSVGMNE